jgi:nicotinamide mononucleotide adenylyltransferase
MERHDMISRAIADNGLPLKIQTQWTEDVYTNQDIHGNIETVDVKGWLIKINGKKYPRQLGEDGIDWTYRYTAPNTEQGRQTAIKRALQEARLTIW